MTLLLPLARCQCHGNKGENTVDGIGLVLQWDMSIAKQTPTDTAPSRLGIAIPDSSIRQRQSSVLNPETWRSVQGFT